MKRTFILTHPEARSRTAAYALQEAPDGAVVTFGDPTRSLEQNAALWGVLSAFAEQLEWPVNGKMVRMSADEWKDVLTAAFKQEQARLAMGLDGGVVMLGLRTSKLSKRDFSDLLEFLHATAAARGVVVHAEETA